ncbi:MAG: NitT/TauT family transport system permease protein [Kosmotogales bacterium]|nr:NitT/TauT family transport system permease protein [Kosmotogales bacterium]
MKTCSIKNNLFIFLLSIGLLIAFWQILYISISNSIILPGPFETFKRLELFFVEGDVYYPLLITSLQALLGMCLAVVCSLFLGFLMGVNNFIFQLFKPIVMFFQAIPIVSWLALAILWWGIGFSSPVYIVFLTLFPILTISIAQGVQSVDVKLVEMAKIYNFSKKQIIIDIYLSSSIPFIISSLRIGIGVMWKSVAVAEFMVGSTGIGREIYDAKYMIETVDVFAWTILLIILGILSEKIFDQFSSKVWRKNGQH